MRAILAEFGIIMPRTLSQLYKKIPEILEDMITSYHLLSVVVSRVNLNTFRVWKIKSRRSNKNLAVGQKHNPPASGS
ncbi:putative transposase [Yersinia enterocolitica]|nr:putative transposase [Yersinia enterocolitica]